MKPRWEHNVSKMRWELVLPDREGISEPRVLTYLIDEVLHSCDREAIKRLGDEKWPGYPLPDAAFR